MWGGAIYAPPLEKEYMLKTITDGSLTYDIPQGHDIPAGFKQVTKSKPAQPKQEQPKQEQPKQEQPKQEQPKQEQPKPEKAKDKSDKKDN